MKRAAWFVVVTAVCGCGGSAASDVAADAGGNAGATSSGGDAGATSSSGGGTGGDSNAAAGTTANPDICRDKELALASAILSHKTCSRTRDCRWEGTGCYFLDCGYNYASYISNSDFTSKQAAALADEIHACRRTHGIDDPFPIDGLSSTAECVDGYCMYAGQSCPPNALPCPSQCNTESGQVYDRAERCLRSTADLVCADTNYANPDMTLSCLERIPDGLLVLAPKYVERLDGYVRCSEADRAVVESATNCP